VRTELRQDPFEPISRGFRERAEGREATTWLLLAGVVAAVAAAALLAWMGRERRPERRLFRRLADESGLTASERRLLRRAAERGAGENWSLLFFRRSLFEESSAGIGADPREVDRVRRKLYAP
jgi:hypothetical protein